MTNSQISLIINILSPLKLDLQKSSARRRFLRHLAKFKEDYDLEAEYIRKEYGEKEPNGALKTINNIVQFTKENRKLGDAKFKELNDLKIPIDWTGEEVDKETMKGVIDGIIAELSAMKEFTDESMYYLETLEGLKKELE